MTCNYKIAEGGGGVCMATFSHFGQLRKKATIEKNGRFPKTWGAESAPATIAASLSRTTALQSATLLAI